MPDLLLAFAGLAFLALAQVLALRAGRAAPPLSRVRLADRAPFGPAGASRLPWPSSPLGLQPVPTLDPWEARFLPLLRQAAGPRREVWPRMRLDALVAPRLGAPAPRGVAEALAAVTLDFVVAERGDPVLVVLSGRDALGGVDEAAVAGALRWCGYRVVAWRRVVDLPDAAGLADWLCLDAP